MLRLIDLTYKVPLTELDKHLAEHREFLQIYYDKGYFIASGPKDPRDGGIILAIGEIDFLNEIIQQDPFYKNKLADYKIISFDPVKKSKAFEKLLTEMRL